MKLLIVDDIPSVVEGMRAGIPWEKLGFTEVFTAYNALEARKVLKQAAIDVMLCDIQMPVENGLELFRWTREQGIEMRTIFLTSHAEFEYVRQVLQMGGFDYIVQPAAYTDIYSSVERAVRDIENSKKREKIEEIGKVFTREEDTLVANCIRNLLLDNPNWDNYNILKDRGLLPDKEKEVYLVLLHIQHWETEVKWEPGLLNMALLNILRELMGAYTSIVIVANMEPNKYAVCLPKTGLPLELLESQLYYFAGVCREYFECTMAMYMSSVHSVREMCQIWRQLGDISKENIMLLPGVFQLEKVKHRNSYVYRMPEISQWAALLREGYPKTMDESACALLDKMVVEEKMNAKTLMMFQLDFMEMLSTVKTDESDYVMEIMNSPEKLRIFCDSTKSIEHMKQFIHLVASGVKEKEDGISPKMLVERIMLYINEHLDEELMREDIARWVNLSPDYMTKLFKNETGITVKEYIIQQKMHMARNLLQTTNLPISFIASKVGFCNFSHFSYTYKKVMGVTPQNERKMKEQYNVKSVLDR